MCIVFFYFSSNESPSYILFNRDSNRLRPTSQINYWLDDKNVVGGRDLVFQGTWLGLNKTTRNISFLTNLEDAELGVGEWLPNKISRGQVINDFVSSNFSQNFASTHKYIDKLLSQSDDYNPFNLVLGNMQTKVFMFVDLFHKKSFQIELDVWHGFSNNLFRTTQFPKVERGLALIQNIPQMNSQKAFEVLEDREDFGRKKEDEASIFVPPYLRISDVQLIMTTCSQYLELGQDKVSIVERTFEIKRLQDIKNFILHRRSVKGLRRRVEFVLFLLREKFILEAENLSMEIELIN